MNAAVHLEVEVAAVDGVLRLTIDREDKAQRAVRRGHADAVDRGDRGRGRPTTFAWSSSPRPVSGSSAPARTSR